MGKKQFGFFQTAETGNRTPDSGVKCFGYKIANQIEYLYLPQNIATLKLSLPISNELNGITPKFEEFK